MLKKGKLELTWVGKEDQPRLEPRVLVEDPSKSYGDPDTENMLIYGDNLLALKALEQDFAGKVKCIFIDPVSHPFLGGENSLTCPVSRTTQFDAWFSSDTSKAPALPAL